MPIPLALEAMEDAHLDALVRRLQVSGKALTRHLEELGLSALKPSDKES